MHEIMGLSAADVQERRARGLDNRASQPAGRSYWAIIQANMFNLFNNILFVIGIALIALGQYNDAMTSVGQGLVNAIIGTVQEIRAKRKLDQIALLSRTKVRVVRDGQIQRIDPADVVMDDVMQINQGDQVVVDGRVLADGRLEMDESLLTGESDVIVKRAGDVLLSGSFCVSGAAFVVVEQLGDASYASRLTNTVRVFQTARTPLQQQISLVVRLVTLVVMLMSGAILVQTVIEQFPLIRIVQISAVLSGQVPYGLFFLVALAYATGAATIAKRGALVQQTNAVESLSNVDVLCMDKTGTLTANRLQLQSIWVAGADPEDQVRTWLGTFARSAQTQNATSEALVAACAASALTPTAEVAFTSARKWSALAFADAHMPGIWVLGALEMLAPYLPDATTAPQAPLLLQAQQWADQGMRVLVFARHADTQTTLKSTGDIVLPALTPVALVAISDELRPHAAETLAAFVAQGIRLKIISGDHPHTVAALARQAGLDASLRAVSGLELDRLSDHEFAEVVDQSTVFGRITPQQKERIVAELMRQGHYVAMMGDGVNDALSLKKAKLGIAMESGSNVTRNVADMILLGDSYAALVPAFREGKKIINGLATSLYLFLARVSTSILIIVMISMIGLGFPYEPAQVALTLFTVGIPTLMLTLWARADTPHHDLLARLVRFVVPVAVVTAVFGVGVYTYFFTLVQSGMQSALIPTQAIARWESFTGLTYATDAQFTTAAATIVAQTALSSFVTLAAFGLIVFLEPPTAFFAGWNPVSPDKRPAWLALGLAVVYFVVLYTPVTANYFGLVTPGGPELKLFAATMPAWFLVLRTIWRQRWMERLFALDDA
jgi:cation-transporting ATPase E